MKIVNMHKRRIPATLSTTKGIIREVKKRIGIMHNLSPPITHTHTHKHTWICIQAASAARARSDCSDRRDATDDAAFGFEVFGFQCFFFWPSAYCDFDFDLWLKPKLLFMLRKWAYSIALHMVLNQLQHALLPACHLPLQSILDADRRSCSCHSHRRSLFERATETKIRSQTGVEFTPSTALNSWHSWLDVRQLAQDLLKGGGE